jgi:hypothetical protein|nr:MAG TPA: hypothetical protein [Caudoviricetes sp.]
MEFGKAAVEKIVRRHLDFIKSRGEKGRSATNFLATLEIFEKVERNEPNVLGTLRTEYSVIEALASAMKAEIERMEGEEN